VSKPLIISDFDGVFNIVNVIDAAREVWADVEDYSFDAESGHLGKIYRLGSMSSPTLIKNFSRIVSSDAVEAKWLTTWKQDTEAFPAALGFPVMEWLDEPKDLPYDPWWKLVVMQNLVAEVGSDTPILWIDDDINMNGDTQEWLPTVPQVEAMSPDTFKGLTPTEVAQISSFVEKHTGAKID
jgi:hypothetical protein